jgi:hypothetical protein
MEVDQPPDIQKNFDRLIIIPELFGLQRFFATRKIGEKNAGIKRYEDRKETGTRIWRADDSFYCYWMRRMVGDRPNH